MNPPVGDLDHPLPELLIEVDVSTKVRPGRTLRRKYFTPDSTLRFVSAR